MAVFAVWCQVGDIGNADARRSSIIDQIRKETNSATWEETTSYILIESAKTTEALAQSIYLNSEMNAHWDKLLVVNVSQKTYAKLGEIRLPLLLENLMAVR